jgi:chaperonin GroEL (HSP60 family)
MQELQHEVNVLKLLIKNLLKNGTRHIAVSSDGNPDIEYSYLLDHNLNIIRIVHNDENIVSNNTK